MSKRLYVESLPFSEQGLAEFVERLSPTGGERHQDATYLLDYPTVYVAHHRAADKYKVYIGETTNIRGRTLQHLTADSRVDEDWTRMSQADDAEMYVIGHKQFNKSLTLDVENRLMQFLTSSTDVVELNNKRSNPQNDYYTRDDFEEIFSQIWRRLRTKNKELFPTERIVRDSALFKASPFHKLTTEQLDAKNQILGLIQAALRVGTPAN